MAKQQFTNILTESFLQQRYVEEGQSTAAIALEAGVTHVTVNRYLRRSNIPLRFNKPVKHTADSSGFRDLSSDWHAYWLGFIAADGCVHKVKGKNSVMLQLHLQKSDADHMSNFMRGLKVSAAIHMQPKTNSAQILLYDKNLVSALAPWGIVPNKTLTMPWPARLPSALVPAYIRGYFDGDGTVFQRQHSKPSGQYLETICRFISGSVSFLEGLQQELQTRGIATQTIRRNQQSNAFHLPVSSRRENLLAFADLLYRDCTVCLERKRSIFQEMERYHAEHPRTGSNRRFKTG